MNYSYFVFALFVFFLFCLCVQFYAKKKGEEIKQKEQRLFLLFENLEEMMDDMEGYVQTVRDEFSLDRVKMDEMLVQMEQFKSIMEEQKQQPPQPEKPKSKRGRPRKNPADAMPKDEPTRPVLVKSKQERVHELMALGLKEEGIAKTLGISKGEVSLIMGMQKQG